MRRVGIDDSRLFSLADKPYALFAGVAPVGQATRKGQMAPMPNCQDNNPFFDVFCFGGLAVVCGWFQDYPCQHRQYLCALQLPDDIGSSSKAH